LEKNTKMDRGTDENEVFVQKKQEGVSKVFLERK
jgi:hypothetical protein